MGKKFAEKKDVATVSNETKIVNRISKKTIKRYLVRALTIQLWIIYIFIKWE